MDLKSPIKLTVMRRILEGYQREAGVVLQVWRIFAEVLKTDRGRLEGR